MRQNINLIQHSQSAMDPKYNILEYVVGILKDYGFKPKIAAYSYYHLVNVLVGFTYQQMQEEELRPTGGGRYMDYQRCITTCDKEKIKNILLCDLTLEDFESESAFEKFLTMTLDGILVQLDKGRD